MSYIWTGNDGSTLPVICHCQLVPGFGRQMPRTEPDDDSDALVTVGRVGDEGRLGDDVWLEFGAGGWLELGDGWGTVGDTTFLCVDDEHPPARRTSETRTTQKYALMGIL